MNILSKNSKVLLVPLVIHNHKRTTIVEDQLTKEFYEMSPASIDAIQLIQNGQVLGDIEESLRSKYPSEDINIVEFLESLVELGLVAEIDGTVLMNVNEVTVSIEDDPKFSNRWPNRLGRVLFRSPVVLIYVVAAVFCLWTLMSEPFYVPDRHSMHMFGSMTVNVLIWVGVSIGLLALHEFSHFLAARSYDLPAKYSVGHRLYFLVLETDISSIWKLSPKQRIIPYIAGMLNDSLVLSISLALRIWYPEMPDIAYEILELTGLYLCVMLVFQTFVFMKTDLYYVLETLSGTLNLQERTNSWIKGLLLRKGEKEVIFIKVYTAIYFIGHIFSIWFFFYFVLPQFLHFLDHARDYLSYPVTDFYFWDGVLFLLFNGATLLLLFYSWMRQLRGYIRSRANVATD